jgi:hypothetical protein
VPSHLFETALGMPLAELAEYAEAATTRPAFFQEPVRGQPEPVFDFILAPRFEGV